MGETKALEPRADWKNDSATLGKVIDSVVCRGDLSGLGPEARARFYIQMCEGLGLNPTSQPFAFLRLNGKEILYATRGATDQLAAMHRVNRKIVDGPKVIDLAGTKLVYAVCEASMPNGRVETATATVPLTDPVNVLMKAETKAKRRATLSILGLGVLDELEIETIPASAQSPGAGLDLSRANDPDPVHEAVVDPTAERPSGVVPVALRAFYARLAEIELPGESVAVWMKYRADLGPLPVADREAAWRALCKRTEEAGRMKNAKVWLKKAIAEEDARRGNSFTEGAPRPAEASEPPVADASAESSEAPEEPDTEEYEADEGPSSRAMVAFDAGLAAAVSLAAICTLYDALQAGLQEEGADVEYWTGGNDGAAARSRAKMRALGHRLNKSESTQVLTAVPLAKLLDTQDQVTSLADAVSWWKAYKDQVRELDQSLRETPWYALARRYSGAETPVMVKAAVKALTDALKPPPSGGSGGASAGGSPGTATRGGAASTGANPTAAKMMLEQLAAHLAAKPRRRDNLQKELAEVCGSYLKRKGLFEFAGIRREALDVARAELRRRGCEEPDALLNGVSNHVYAERAM